VKVVVLSSVYPNPRQPSLGGFIRKRMERVARGCELVVVAPIPWFPGNRWVRGPRWSGIPAVETQGVLRVHHPRFISIPRFLKALDGLLYAMSLAPFLSRLRRQFPFELLDAHFSYPDGVGAALLGRLLRCPVVITLRGSIVRLARYPAHRPQIRAALGAAARVLSVSQSLKDVAVGLGIPPEKIRVIPNGVDADRFFPRERAVARKALSLHQDGTILLSVGGLNEGKGFQRLVGVLPRLLARRPDLRLVIVGGERPGDSVRPALERLIAAHRLERHVTLVGERPHAEIPLWMAAADVFCLATRSEGWSNVLLEALACGRPVVATRVGGNPEIVPDERYGLLVEPQDDAALAGGIAAALERTWDPADLAAHAHRHPWDEAAHRVLEEFEQALAVHRDARRDAAQLSAPGGSDR
jgi:teichuronic acid biosynthesis glycosyltransferase TuaC